MQRNPGYEPMVQAFAGLFSINGYPDRPGARIGTSVLDLGSATWAALGHPRWAAAAAAHRQGVCRRRIAVRDGAGPAHGAFRTLPGELDAAERHPSGSLAVVIFQAIDTADGQVIVAAANDRLFAKLAVELGHPEWVEDARFKTNADRHANKDTLIPLVEQIMRGHPSEVWVARLEKVGVPCAAINDLTHMKAHPQTAALGMVQPVPEIDLELMSLPLSLDGERPASAPARPSSASTTPCWRAFPRRGRRSRAQHEDQACGRDCCHRIAKSSEDPGCVETRALV